MLAGHADLLLVIHTCLLCVAPLERFHTALVSSAAMPPAAAPLVLLFCGLRFRANHGGRPGGRLHGAHCALLPPSGKNHTLRIHVRMSNPRVQNVPTVVGILCARE